MFVFSFTQSYCVALGHFEYSEQVLCPTFMVLLVLSFLKLDSVASVTLSLNGKEQLTEED